MRSLLHCIGIALILPVVVASGSLASETGATYRELQKQLIEVHKIRREKLIAHNLAEKKERTRENLIQRRELTGRHQQERGALRERLQTPPKLPPQEQTLLLQEQTRRHSAEWKAFNKEQNEKTQELVRHQRKEWNEYYIRRTEDWRLLSHRDFDTLRQRLKESPTITATGNGPSANGPVTVDAEPECKAPDVVVHLYITDPNCEQMWDYDLFRRLAIVWFAGEQNMLDLQESRAETIHSTVALGTTLATIANALVDVFGPNKEIITRVVDAHFDSAKVAVSVFAYDDEIADQTRTLILSFVEGSQMALKAGMTNTAPPTPHVQLIDLANNIAAWWNIENIAERRHTLIIAQSYLEDFYRFGSDHKELALANGLDPNASVRETVDAVGEKWAPKTWFGRDYKLGQAVEIVEYFKEQVDLWTQICSQGDCPDLERALRVPPK